MLSILTILLDKCQTKSFEDMNILIKAITTDKMLRRFSTLIVSFFILLAVFLGRLSINSEKHAMLGKTQYQFIKLDEQKYFKRFYNL